ncbi:MAG: polysaccharide biosynthesis tyrosine autokinase [Alcanivoracaceae bacterium]|nr:polysaccharide biosynthesis tyrosine autokinase [Alcanivoracaceae bacterium]
MQQTERADDEIDLTRVWALLVDRRLRIAIVAVVALALAIAYATLATPIYRAEALLQVEDKQGGVPGFAELSEMFVQESSAQAEIEILRSRLVLNDAVDQLRLDIKVRPDRLPIIGRFGAGGASVLAVPPFASYSDGKVGIAFDEFFVPEWMQDEDLRLVATANGFELYQDGVLLLSGPVGTMVKSDDAAIAVYISALSAKPGSTFVVSQASRLSVIKAIRSNFSISEQGKNTGILKLSYKGSSKSRIKLILDAITQSYLLQNIKRLSAQAQNSLDFLDKQLPEMRENLRQSEDELNRYRLESESVDLTLETKSVLERLVDIESKINELRFKESEVSRLYTKEHPSYQTLVQQRGDLVVQRDKLNEQIKSLPETQQEVLRLTRDAQVNQEIYVQMLNKVQELRILKAGTVGNVRIIDDAIVDGEPVAPRKSLVVVLGAMFGLMIGIGWTFVEAVFHRGIDSPDQLEAEGIAVYATVPQSDTQVELSEKIAGKRHKRSGVRQLLSLEDPADLAVESLRSLRTSLHFAMMDVNNPVLMITGPSPGIGKSFISSNLAVVLAQINKRVLLIDVDMRRGYLHQYFKAPRSIGLSSYLSGQHSLSDVILPTQVSNLSFIAAGSVPPNPAELLMSPAWKQMIDTVSKDYDLIILDTPPVLAVTDPAIIGQTAGTALMVVRFEENSVKETQVALSRLERNGVNVKGVVLNYMLPRAGRDHGYYSYKYESNLEQG